MAAPRQPSPQATLQREARSTTSHHQTLRLRPPTKVRISSSSRASGLRRWAFFGRRRGRWGKASTAFFINLAMVIRATPVAHTVLRWELRSVSKTSTWAYRAALATAAGTTRA